MILWYQKMEFLSSKNRFCDLKNQIYFKISQNRIWLIIICIILYSEPEG